MILKFEGTPVDVEYALLYQWNVPEDALPNPMMKKLMVNELVARLDIPYPIIECDNLGICVKSWIKELRQLSAVILSNDHIEDYLNFADKWPFKSIFITNA
ncbi:17156_t:CDS:2 [Rhizophagus irregularis]|nr:17156_t:CDS:2 [Rhizophagus irregularis]